MPRKGTKVFSTQIILFLKSDLRGSQNVTLHLYVITYPRPRITENVFVIYRSFEFLQKEQLKDHEERVTRLENELDEHRETPPEKGSKSLIIQNFKEKETYLIYEVFLIITVTGGHLCICIIFLGETLQNVRLRFENAVHSVHGRRYNRSREQHR